LHARIVFLFFSLENRENFVESLFLIYGIVKNKMITFTQFKINFDDYLFEANILYELEIRMEAIGNGNL